MLRCYCVDVRGCCGVEVFSGNGSFSSNVNVGFACRACLNHGGTEEHRVVFLVFDLYSVIGK